MYSIRDRGHEAYSCDIIPCSGGHPEWHILGNCLDVINGNFYARLETGEWITFNGKWDLIIAHPPCTYLTTTGTRWFDVEKYGEKAEKRIEEREKAIRFFVRIAQADCERIAIENPVGIMSSSYRKPDQIINPCMFGDPYEKRTCLWLKNLPLLWADKPVKPEKRKTFESGRSMPLWYAERAKVRSRTYPGIARAMAEQWGCINVSE